MGWHFCALQPSKVSFAGAATTPAVDSSKSQLVYQHREKRHFAMMTEQRLSCVASIAPARDK